MLGTLASDLFPTWSYTISLPYLSSAATQYPPTLKLPIKDLLISTLWVWECRRIHVFSTVRPQFLCLVSIPIQQESGKSLAAFDLLAAQRLMSHTAR